MYLNGTGKKCVKEGEDTLCGKGKPHTSMKNLVDPTYYNLFRINYENHCNNPASKNKNKLNN